MAENSDDIDYEAILELVTKYKELKKNNGIKRYNEEQTKNDFIIPLFKALGWNVENKSGRDSSMSLEEKISKKRVDFGFRINGIPKFFVEAKALREENIQTNLTYVSQAIDYSWMKACSWAILTNFETLAVYNADWKDSNYRNNQYFVLHTDDFLKDEMFERLSKASFQKNELDEIASKVGKKQFKNPIDKQLLQDMIHFREILSKNIVQNNSGIGLTQDEVDESVQRILDRLIFIRSTEDRIYEENKLQSNLRQWASRGKGALLKEINRIYKEYDDTYNSKLFAHHLCDELYLDNEVLQEVIEGLNESKDHFYRYDFSAIEADVLGNIYEQYLGNLLKTTPKRAKLSESRIHRKEQGIYYTPSYIVDYIVKKTVGEFIRTHNASEIEKVRILDPACGSGSFLIRAYQELENYWLNSNKNQTGTIEQTRFDIENEGQFYNKKVEILKNNIFGIDLDPKAVEITQLNLLMKVSEKKQRLPILKNNVRVGNSIIDDPTIDERAFEWRKEFPDIMSQGGFDIVIGNPPYVRQEELTNIKSHLGQRYSVYQGTADLFVYFFEREMEILKENGYFGMIVSNKWLRAGYGTKLRKFLSDFWIEEFVDFGDLKVFPDATIYPSIIFLKKQRKKNKTIRICKMESIPNDTLGDYVEDHTYRISQNDLDEREWIVQKKDSGLLLRKIRSMGVPLTNFVGSKIYYGIKTGLNEAFLVKRETKEHLISGDSRNKEIIKPFITGAEIKRYRIEPDDNYIILTKNGTKIENYPLIYEHLSKYQEALEKRWDKGEHWYELRACSYYDLFERPKIVWGNLSTGASFAFDLGDKWYVNAPACILPTDSKYVLGIMNSSLMSYFLKSICAERQGGFIEQKPVYVSQIPIKTPSPEELEEITNLVDKLLLLNKKLSKLLNKQIEERIELELKIKELDRSLNEVIYKLYDIGDEERKIIESS